MSTDRDALFRAVCADHEDDTPRLAYADWLDEHDEPARAEFVRLQIELAGLLADASDSQAVYRFLVDRDWVTHPAAKWEAIDAGIARRVHLAGRLEALWKEHGPAWLTELPAGCGVNWVGFYRGFPGAVEVTDLERLADSAAEVVAAAPPVEFVCYGLTGDEAERLVDAGLLPWVRGLAVQGDCADGLRVLGRHPASAGVRTLRVHGPDPTGGGMLAVSVAGSPHWAGLQFFAAENMKFDATPAEVLFRAGHLRTLRHLRIEGHGWTADTLRTFAEAAFPNLLDLQFTASELDDAAADVLANLPSLRTVRYFDVGNNRITGRGATALLCSPHLAGMAFVGLEDNPVRGLDRKALNAAPPGGLRLFHAHGCRLSVTDVGAVARSPRLRDLWYLDLDANDLGPGAAREIVRGFKDRCPPVVWLTMNRLDDDSAAKLADWPGAERLRVLELYQNPLTARGVNALLASPHLRNLDGLGVPSHLGEEVTAAVRARFGDRGRLE